MINCAAGAGEEILLCGANGLVISSSDFFDTYLGSTQCIPGNITAICRPDPSGSAYLLFTREGSIYQHDRADTSYSLVYENPEFTFTDWAQHGDTLVATASGDAIAISTDRGGSWSVVPHTSDVFFYTVEYFNGCFFLAGEKAHIVSFGNGEFTRLHPHTEYDFHCAVECNGMLYAGTFGGRVVVSENRGLTWDESKQLPGEIITGIESDGEGNMLLVTSGGSICRFNNGTETFDDTEAGISEEGFQGLHFTGGSFYAVSRYGDIYKLKSGDTWQMVYQSDDSTAITDLCINGEDSTGFAVGDRGKILNTDNGGEEWFEMEALVDFPLFSVCRINDTWMFAGMYGILYYSTDGTEWESSLSRFPDGDCYTALSGKPDGAALLATTISGQVLLSKDMGSNWERLYNGYALMTDIVWMDDNTALALGHNSTVYEMMLEGVTVEEKGASGGFLLYPLPAEEQLIVRTGKNDMRIRSYNIFDLSGRMIISAPVTGGPEFTIDVSGLAPGVYFLNLLSDRKSHTQKIVLE